MDQFLFTVRYSFDHKKDGITVCPGVPPNMVDAIIGAQLACKRPDGKMTHAVVSRISPLCQHPDERLALCLSKEVTLADVPIGTEIFLFKD